FSRDWSSDVCSSDLGETTPLVVNSLEKAGELPLAHLDSVEMPIKPQRRMGCSVQCRRLGMGNGRAQHREARCVLETRQATHSSEIGRASCREGVEVM